MTEPKQFRARAAGQHHFGADLHADAPGWSHGIRALYDAVVQEPLPADLLRLLDELGQKTAK